MAWGPAHFIVVDAKGWRAYFDGGYGEYMFARLVGGPEAALAYIRNQWLDASSDDVSGEPLTLDDLHAGGALVDLVRKELLWFCRPCDVWSPSPVFRRVFGRLLVEMWPGWRVRWAYRGAEELAGRIDPRYHKILHRKDIWRERRMSLAPSDNDVEYVGDTALYPNAFGVFDLLTMRAKDGTMLVWGLEESYGPAHLAWLGVELLDRLPEIDKVATPARLYGPQAGLHVDVPGHRLGLWSTAWVANLLTELPKLWPGWQVSFWEDHYEEHAAAVSDEIALPACDTRAAALGEGRFEGFGLLREPDKLFEGHGLDPSLVLTTRERLIAAAAKVRQQLTPEGT